MRATREELRDYASVFRWAFPLRCSATNLRYRQSAKGKFAYATAKTRYYQTAQGKARRREGNKRYRQTERGRAKKREIDARYDARKRGNACGDSAVVTKVYERAQELRQWFDVVVDHIIPLVRGGAHSPENLQIIYRFENESKGTRLDYKPRVIFT